MATKTKPLKSTGIGCVNDLLLEMLWETVQLNKDPVVGEHLQRCLNTALGLEKYLDKTASEQTPIQDKILRDTYSENWRERFESGKTGYHASTNMMSGYLEGQFLRIVAQMTRAKRVLEIGMFTGYSAVSFAESNHCEEVVCLEYEPYFKSFLKERIAGTHLEKKIDVLVGVALDNLQVLKEQGKVFDLVFIDADKSNYINYYNFIMDNGLLDKNGTFLIDNTLWMGQVFPTPTTTTGKHIYDFNEHARQDKRVNQVILPLRDGVSLIQRKEDGPT